jgi:hypothetical protein
MKRKRRTLLKAFCQTIIAFLCLGSSSCEDTSVHLTIEIYERIAGDTEIADPVVQGTVYGGLEAQYHYDNGNFGSISLMCGARAGSSQRCTRQLGNGDSLFAVSEPGYRLLGWDGACDERTDSPDAPMHAYISLSSSERSTCRVTFAREGTPDRPVVELSGPTSIAIGEAATVTATITGGTEPYTLVWSPTPERSDDSARQATFSFTAAGSETVTLEVTDSLGEQGSDTLGIEVTDQEPGVTEVELTDDNGDGALQPLELYRLRATYPDPGGIHCYTWSTHDGETYVDTGITTNPLEAYATASYSLSFQVVIFECTAGPGTVVATGTTVVPAVASVTLYCRLDVDQGRLDPDNLLCHGSCPEVTFTAETFDEADPIEHFDALRWEWMVVPYNGVVPFLHDIGPGGTHTNSLTLHYTDFADEGPEPLNYIVHFMFESSTGEYGLASSMILVHDW